VKPVIALVGRPNVGKSTLFNRITKSRDAIVADFAGLTRDRHYGDARLGSQEFIVVDTGGFEPAATEGVVVRMAAQTKQAVAEADAVILVTDVRAGLSAQDHEIARFLRAGQQARAAGRQQGRGHARRATDRRVPRTRHRRAASGFGGARAGHPQLARGGVGGLFRSMKTQPKMTAATSARSVWPWPDGRTSASRP
jgi:small GTP-binding protein